MERNQWKEYVYLIFGDNLTDKELVMLFLCNPSDAFAIYQLADHEKTRDYRFTSIAQLQATGLTVDRANYEVMYTAALPDGYKAEIPKLLEDLFCRFNAERPEGFYGHCLSVSDVVALKLNDAVSVHYVDRFGFQELHGFLCDPVMKNAQRQTEDNYGMIDGVIERETEPERPSVVQQLRNPPCPPKAHAKGMNEPSID